MVAAEFVFPAFRIDAFNCPHCNAFAHQSWNNYGRYWVSSCQRCGDFALWVNKTMVYPTESSAPLPNKDLPNQVLQCYSEARDIVRLSPKGAAALLRLAIQHLCIYLGQRGNLNDMIANLVQDGLHHNIQKALDVVRVVGNDAVHPGVIDLDDDRETALGLFSLVNQIAHQMITVPKEIDALYAKLPESKKEAIAKRDRKES